MAILISTFFMPVFITKVNAATSTTNQTGGTAGTWYYTLNGSRATKVQFASALKEDIIIPTKLDNYTVVSIENDFSDRS